MFAWLSVIEVEVQIGSMIFRSAIGTTLRTLCA